MVHAAPIDFGRNPFDGYETVDLAVIAGGDGTINYVVNRMKEKGLNLLLGLIPAGTANDFATALGMAHDPLRAAAQILAGEEQRIDCGRVNDQYFVNIFSFGLFTTTSQRTSDEQKHRIGRLAYLIEGVREFRSMHAIPLQIRADGEAFDLDSLITLVFNGVTAGGFHLTRQVDLQDGRFECVMLEHRNPLRSALAMGRYLLGDNPRLVKRFRAREIEIFSPVNEPTDVDGQQGAEFPLRIECLPGALRILCPPRVK